MTGHDRPLFGPDDMGDAGHVPADNVIVADGPVAAIYFEVFVMAYNRYCLKMRPM
jgi:hypothetical protein